MMTFKNRIVSTLEEMEKAKSPGWADKANRPLALLFIYQTIRRWAEARLKDNLKKYCIDNNISLDHNNYTVGKHILKDTSQYTLLFSVSSPRNTLSKEVLQAILQDDYNISVDDCQDIIKRSTIPGSKAITKEIIIKGQ
jgi:hypothetical protein